MTSLQTPLSTVLILALVALVALAVAIGGYSLRRLAEDFVAARLEQDLGTVLAALTFDASGQPQLAADRIGAAFHQPYSGRYYQIETPRSEICSRSLWDTDLTLPPLAADRATRIFLAGPQKQRLLAVGRAFRVQNQPVSILVTEDFAPVDVGLRRLLLEFSLIACAVLAALLLQRWIVRRGLAPLEEVRPELPKLAHDEISRLSIHAPDEVRPLVAELNRLLELVDQGQRRARHSLGNLAHALKTPLTALTQLTDRPPPAGDAKGWWEDLRQQIRHIGALTERELKRARIGGGGIPGQRVLLAGEVGDLIETLRRIHRDRALHFELRIPPDSAFPGDRDDLLELLGNLLDNACQWASRTVRLTAGTDADG